MLEAASTGVGSYSMASCLTVRKKGMRSSGCHTVAANRPPGLSTRQNSRTAAVWLGRNLQCGTALQDQSEEPAGYYRKFGGRECVIKPRGRLAPWPPGHSPCAQRLYTAIALPSSPPRAAHEAQ